MSEWRRVPAPEATLVAFPNARMWQKSLDDGHLTVLRTVERQSAASPWRTHLSISHRLSDGTRAPGRYPTWDEQKEAVYRFAPGKWMISILPPTGEPYVNVHSTTFHWWEAPENIGNEIL